MTAPAGALAATLAKLPDHPGVYLMRDARGTVLYVGKAQSLRHRVRSYWQRRGAAEPPLRIESSLDRVTDVEYTLTDTVSEALLLEANLIKRYQPRFNVRLKDDKSYPFIKVTLADDFPRIERTRKLPADGSRYFGPYASATSVDEAKVRLRRDRESSSINWRLLGKPVRRSVFAAASKACRSLRSARVTLMKG